MEKIMSFYHMVEDHVWDIAKKIKNKTHGEDNCCTKQENWEFLYGDIYAQFRSERSRCRCGGCGEYESLSIDFPAKLIWENEDGIEKYLETLEEKGVANDDQA
jgi:hypothetical protein